MKKLATIFALCLLLITSPVLAQNVIRPDPYGVLFRNNTAIGTATLTTNQMVGFLLGTPVAAATYTTPTAVNMCASLPLVTQRAQGVNTNFGYIWVIANNSGGANTITVAAGAGVTLTGTMTVAQNTARAFYVVYTQCTPTPAVTIFSLGVTATL